MDARVTSMKAPSPHELPHESAVPLVTPPLTVSAQSPLPATSWPRSAQWAAAALLGLVLVLLAYQSLASTSHGARATQLVTADGPIYRLDLNRARVSELMQVPGIGPTLAERIVTHRDTSGPFPNLAELRKVSGIGDKTLARIKPWLCVVLDDGELHAAGRGAMPTMRNPQQASKGSALAGQNIDINAASLEELQRLPGIGPKLAQRIVEERDKRRFGAVNELRRIKGIGPKTLEKLRPFVTAGE